MAKILQYTNDGVKAEVQLIKETTSMREARGQFERMKRNDADKEDFEELGQDSYRYKIGMVEYKIDLGY